MRRAGIAAAVTVSVLALASTLPAPAVAATNPPKPERVACRYFTALRGSSDATGAAAAAGMAADGSLAHAYAVHQVAIRAARRAQGFDSPEEVRCKKSKVKSGVFSHSKNSPEGTAQKSIQRSVIKYTQFTIDEQGLLTDFRVDGNSLDGRIIESKAPAVGALGTQSRLVTAYQSVASDGDLYVILDLAGAPDAVRYVDLYGAVYESPTGSTTTASSAWGPVALQPGMKANGVLIFPAQPIGGVVNLGVEPSVVDNPRGDIPGETARIPVS